MVSKMTVRHGAHVERSTIRAGSVKQAYVCHFLPFSDYLTRRWEGQKKTSDNASVSGYEATVTFQFGSRCVEASCRTLPLKWNDRYPQTFGFVVTVLQLRSRRVNLKSR